MAEPVTAEVLAEKAIDDYLDQICAHIDTCQGAWDSRQLARLVLEAGRRAGGGHGTR